jgi:HTH-type transcriptional regulator / antitoxin HigA
MRTYTTAELNPVKQVWPDLAPRLFVPRSEANYERLDALIDRVGGDEAHPLDPLMDVVGTLIERFEEGHVPELPSQQPWSGKSA